MTAFDPESSASRALIVGYGNTLRGDDAAGLLVAEAIQALGLELVDVQVCHQLTPDISERVAAAGLVIFIDAREGNDLLAEVREIVASHEAPVFGHAVDPRAILSLARGLFGRSPRAWLVTVAARSFELGADPSPECVAGMALAREAVRGLCEAVNRGETVEA